MENTKKYKKKVEDIKSALKSLIINELDNLSDSDLWDIADNYANNGILYNLMNKSESLKDRVVSNLTSLFKQKFQNNSALIIPENISKSVEFIDLSNTKYYIAHFRNSNSTDSIEYVNINELINIYDYLAKNLLI